MLLSFLACHLVNHHRPSQKNPAVLHSVIPMDFLFLLCYHSTAMGVLYISVVCSWLNLTLEEVASFFFICCCASRPSSPLRGHSLTHSLTLSLLQRFGYCLVVSCAIVCLRLCALLCSGSHRGMLSRICGSIAVHGLSMAMALLLIFQASVVWALFPGYCSVVAMVIQLGMDRSEGLDRLAATLHPQHAAMGNYNRLEERNPARQRADVERGGNRLVSLFLFSPLSCAFSHAFVFACTLCVFVDSLLLFSFPCAFFSFMCSFMYVEVAGHVRFLALVVSMNFLLRARVCVCACMNAACACA